MVYMCYYMYSGILINKEAERFIYLRGGDS